MSSISDHLSEEEEHAQLRARCCEFLYLSSALFEAEYTCKHVGAAYGVYFI